MGDGLSCDRKDLRDWGQYGFYEGKEAIAAQSALGLANTLTLKAALGVGVEGGTQGRVGFSAAW